MLRSEKTLAECSVDDLMDEIANRCPAVAIAALIPDDGDECGTRTMLHGNRAACLGLSDILHKVMAAKMLAAILPYEPKEDDGDDDSDNPTNGG